MIKLNSLQWEDVHASIVISTEAVHLILCKQFEHLKLARAAAKKGLL